MTYLAFQQEPDTRCTDDDNRWVTNTWKCNIEHSLENTVVFLHPWSCHLWRSRSVQITGVGFLLERVNLLTFTWEIRESQFFLNSTQSRLHFEVGCGPIMFPDMWYKNSSITVLLTLALNLFFPPWGDICLPGLFSPYFVLLSPDTSVMPCVCTSIIQTALMLRYTCIFERGCLWFAANNFERQ